MIISRDIQKYIALSETPVSDVLKKISDNKSRILFVVSEHGMLLGSLSDGDVRRWLINSEAINLSEPVSSLMNTNCIKLVVDADKQKIASAFKEGIDCIPLVDVSGRLERLAFKAKETFQVGNREIGEGQPTYIIAEIGNNHQGDIGLAFKLVDYAVEAGVDCVKFQMRDIRKLYRNNGSSNDASADLGAQYTMDLLERFQLSNNELFEVFDYCKRRKVQPLCTPWDLNSLGVLEKYGMPAYKVASADFTNYELLEAISRTGKPFFCSTGMSSEKEIIDTVNFLDGLSANYVLLHCNSTYPTPYKDVNLKYLMRLKKITGHMVGYSGHERGIEVPVASVALGACVIEKHITIDTSLEGADHKVSLLPHELAAMVKMVRNVEDSLGNPETPREITQGEMINRESLAKSLIAKVNIEEGQIITRDLIEIKSPGQGLQPNRLNDLVGKVAERKIFAGGYFYPSDIHGVVKKKEKYGFSRPYGVPVRYHDYEAIVDGVDLDFVEFHLSYKDMQVDLHQCFSGLQKVGFAVHSPELFSGDHILDLCSDDASYRARSVAELQKVVDITRELKEYFPSTKTPVIVVNAGGWDRQSFIDPSQKEEKYALVSESLRLLEAKGVQIAIQTMPPFPWHFGGQSFHNLFVCPEEIAKFCKENPAYKICLDISHTMMACNYYGWNLLESIEKIAEYNVHMHVADAKGVDGEGVEMGDGDVDFIKVFQLLDKRCQSVQFIPEVWQGHKNGGEGFWKALSYLERAAKTASGA